MNFVDFSNAIIQSNDIDPDYIFMMNYKDAYGEEKAFELLKKKILIYNLHSELLYTDKLITHSEIKFGNERQKSKNNFIKWEMELSRIDFKKLYKFHRVDYLVFRENFKKIKGMGDWATWKTADILEKVFGIKMLYDEMTFLYAYQFPLKGLLMINNRQEDLSLYKNKQIYLQDYRNAQRIAKNICETNVWNPNNVLELETLLCKYHSYKHNHYSPNADLNKLRKIKQDKRLLHYHNLLP